jgi:hypothetical protein
MFVTCLSVMVAGYSVARFKLTLVNDFFLLVVYAEIVIYLHIAPTLWQFELPDDMQTEYVVLQAAAVLLFEIPLLWLYGRLSRASRAVSRYRPCVLVNKRKQLILALGAFCLSCAFLVVALNEDVFFMRIGYEGAVQAILNLTLGQFVVYRMFGLAGAFLVTVLTASILVQRNSTRRAVGQRRFVFWLTAFVAVVLFLYQGFNSRLHVAVVALVLTGTVLALTQISLKSKKGLLLGVATAFVIWYGFHFAINARNMISDSRLSIRVIDPFLSWEQPDELSDWRFRLNGIDLMARIAPYAEHEGFANGEAWRGFVTILVGQVTFGSLVSTQDVAAYKAVFAGSPKKYLIDRYLGADWIDHPSCLLTDLYGNFGLCGFPLGAIAVACLCFYIRRAFGPGRSPVAMIVAPYVAFHLLIFEQEFAVLVSGLINTLPALFCILISNPFIIEKPVPDPAPVHSLGLRNTTEASAR